MQKKNERKYYVNVREFFMASYIRSKLEMYRLIEFSCSIALIFCMYLFSWVFSAYRYVDDVRLFNMLNLTKI